MSARTVIDLIRESPAAAVLLFLRHASYLMGPIQGRYQTPNEATAANYAELEPPCLFLLDDAGIQLSRQQGWRLAEAGIAVREIVASHQGRGPDTGLRISEGHHQATSRWIPVRCHAAVDYPRYNFGPVLRCLNGIGDPFVAQWLNGQHPDLVRSDTPRSFRGRVMGFVDDLLAVPGVAIVTSHFENVTLVHGRAVEGRDLGTVREDWFPTKSGGVILVRQPGGAQTAHDFRPDLTIVE